MAGNEIVFKVLGDVKDIESKFGKLKGQFDKLARGSAVAFAASSGAIIGLTKTFGDFSQKMSNISTLVDTTTESMSDMKKEVLDMSSRIPVKLNDLTSALYDVRSAGVSAAKQFEVLENSAKLGVAGLGTTAESVDLVTSALNEFGEEAGDSAQVADVIFKTVKAGKNTVSQLAQSFGATAASVHAGGVAFDDFMASVAAMTAAGIPASVSMTYIQQAVVALQKPTENLNKIYKRLGVTTGKELIEKSGGVGKAFKLISEEADKMGLSMVEVTPRVQGANAMIKLGTTGNEAYVKTLASMRDGTDLLTEAYEKQKQEFNAAMQIMFNQGQRLAIVLGEKLAPVVLAVGEAFGKLADFLSSNPVFGTLAAVVLTATAAISGFLMVVGLMGGGILRGVMFIKSMAAAVMGLNTAFLMSPITWIIAGIAAAVAVLYIAWKNNFFGMRDIVANVFTWLQQAFVFLKKVFLHFWEKIGPSVKAGFKLYIEGWKMMFEWAKWAFEGVKGIAVWLSDNVIKPVFRGMFDFMIWPFSKLLDFYNWVMEKMGKEPLNLAALWKQAGDEIAESTNKINSSASTTATPTALGDNDDNDDDDDDILPLPPLGDIETNLNNRLALHEVYYQKLAELQNISTVDALEAQREKDEAEYEMELERLEALRELKREDAEEQRALKQKIADEEARIETEKQARIMAYDKQMSKLKKDRLLKDNKDIWKMLEEGLKKTKEYAIYQKIVAGGEAIINTAKAITDALGSAPFPANLVNAAIVGAQGAAQIATIAGVSFAVGTDFLPDDMNISAHKGEAIIPARENQFLQSGKLALVGTGGSTPGGNVTQTVTHNHHYDGILIGTKEELAETMHELQAKGIQGGRLAPLPAGA